MEEFINYDKIEIEEVCRICLVKKGKMSLISETGLADKLIECASIQVRISFEMY